MKNLDLINDMFTCDAFSQVNIVMIQKLGLAAAIVCNELEQRDNYWTKKNVKEWYATYADLIEKTGLTYKQVVHSVKKLENENIVKTEPPVYQDGIKIKYYDIDFSAKDEFMRSPFDGSVSRNYAPDNFIVYSKKLAQKISPECAILIRDMCRTYIETAKRGKLLDDEWFECKQTKLAKKCGVTPKTMVDYMKKMIAQNIIEVKQAGWPKTSYAKINFDTLLELFDYGSWEEVEETVASKAAQRAQKKMTVAESLTIKLLEEVKKVSGQDWDMTHKKAADIEDRMSEGYTENQLISIIKYTYNHYKDGEYENLFNWDNLIGQPSKVNYWLKRMAEKADDEKELAYAKLVTEHICNKMKSYSNGEVDWVVDDKKINSIRKILAWEDDINEEDLMNFATSRYDWYKANGKKMKAFSTLFSKDEKENMLNNKADRQRKSNKSYAKKNKESRDGVTCNSYTQAQKEQFKRRAAEIEASGEQGVF